MHIHPAQKVGWGWSLRPQNLQESLLSKSRRIRSPRCRRSSCGLSVRQRWFAKACHQAAQADLGLIDRVISGRRVFKICVFIMALASYCRLPSCGSCGLTSQSYPLVRRYSQLGASFHDHKRKCHPMRRLWQAICLERAFCRPQGALPMRADNGLSTKSAGNGECFVGSRSRIPG